MMLTDNVDVRERNSNDRRGQKLPDNIDKDDM